VSARAAAPLIASAVLLRVTAAGAEGPPSPAPPALPTAGGECPAACHRTRGAIETTTRALAAALGRLPEGVLVVGAPLESDEEAPRGGELAALLVSHLAGKLGGRAHAEPLALTDARRAAADAGSPALVRVVARVVAGRLDVVADLVPVSRTVWARARATEHGPVAHAHFRAPLDAEVRGYLRPLSLGVPRVTKISGSDPGVLAVACGDLDDDGALELATVTRQRVLLVRQRGDALERVAEARWSELGPLAGAPLRQPLAFATIVERPGGGWLDAALSDRAESVRLGLRSEAGPAHLAVLARMAGLAIPSDGGTACSRVRDLLLDGRPWRCRPEDDVSDAEPGRRADAIAARAVVRADGSVVSFTATRDERGVVAVRAGAVGRPALAAGAQLALGDLDQDGAPELAASLDVRDPARDAVELFTLRDGGVEKRWRLVVPSGVGALAVCPPDATGPAALVLGTGDELWIVR
jgi:hypothetical protein